MIPVMVNAGKRKTTSLPSLRDSTGASFGGAVATGVTVTMPGTVQAGDWAIFGVTTKESFTLGTVPAGLTKIYDSRDWRKSTNASGNSVGESLSIFTRLVQPGDAGSTWTFKVAGSGSREIVCALGVYQNVDHIAAKPKGYTHYAGSWVGSTPLLQVLNVSDNSLIVGFVSSSAPGNFNETYPKLSTIDSNFTIRQSFSKQVNGLSPAVGLALVDGPTQGWLEDDQITFVNSSVTGWTHVALELAGPNAKGWFENEHVPTSLAGKPVYCYGTSNTNMIPRTNIDLIGGKPGAPDEPKWTNQMSYPDWLIDLIDPGHLGNHMGIGGTNSVDNVTFAFGSHSNPTQAVTQDLIPDVSQVDQAGTWKAQTNRDLGGLVLLDIYGNDILYEASPSSEVRDGVAIATDSMIRLLRSKYVRPYNYTGTTFSANWAAQSSDGADSSAYSRTITNGAYVEIVTTETNPEFLLLVNAAAGVAGSSYEVKVDGVVVSTGTTKDRMKTGGSSPTPAYNYVQMAIPLVLNGASHTVRITHTGAGGEYLRYQGFLVPKTVDAEIPYIVLMGMQKVSPIIFAAGQTQARLDAYLTILRNGAAQFPSKVLVYDPMASGGWAAQGLDADYGPAASGDGAFTLDGIHMHAQGHAFFALDILRFLNERIS